MQLTTHRLDNGLVVAALSSPGVKSACLMADIHSGSRNDCFGLEGEHHAFEHMPFRGMEGFPNKEAWALPLERHGVDVANANTGFCRTRYALEVPVHQFALAAKHLAALVYEPKLKEEDWVLERGVILREWEQSQNSEGCAYSCHLLPILFPNSKHLQHIPIGSPDSINAITTDRLRTIHRRDYTLRNSQLVVAGNIPCNWQDVFNSTFGSLTLYTGQSHRVAEPVPQVGGQRHTVNHELFKQPMVGMWGLFKAPDDRTRAALGVFRTMLGVGSISSPLFQEIREQNQLVYSYGLEVDQLLPGLTCVTFRCNTKLSQVEEVQQRFWSVVARTMKNAERFEFARDRKLGKMRLGTFEPEEEADDVADQLLMDGRYVSDEQKEEIIGSLTFEEVQAAARAYFAPENFCVLTMRR